MPVCPPDVGGRQGGHALAKKGGKTNSCELNGLFFCLFVFTCYLLLCGSFCFRNYFSLDLFITIHTFCGRSVLSNIFGDTLQGGDFRLGVDK